MPASAHPPWPFQVTVAEHTVHITTYSQGYWNDPFHEVFDNLDTGFTYTSAQEIATKLAQPPQPVAGRRGSI